MNNSAYLSATFALARAAKQERSSSGGFAESFENWCRRDLVTNSEPA